MITQVTGAEDAALEKAARLIRQGQLVGFPTETVYGLGANALDGQAVEKIFIAKGRPGDNPLIVHVSHLDMVYPLIEGPLPEAAKKLARACWPGPLTMILPKSPLIPHQVSAGLSTVGIRMPAHPVARRLIQLAGVPIAAPSGNRSGRPSPTRASHMLEDMAGRIPLIIDGGDCQVGLESTVLDLCASPARVLRPGGVTAEMIGRVLGSVEVDGSVLRPLMEGEVARSPGMKYRHYAPKGLMTIVKGKGCQGEIIRLYDQALAAGENPCILALAHHMKDYADRQVKNLGRDENQAASSLFALLRQMDEAGVTRIFSEGVDAQGLGLAVMNRMGRAAAFDVIDLGEEERP